jgi:Flp pilus assembly pilin Flp
MTKPAVSEKIFIIAEDARTMVEYGLIVALVALAAAAAASIFGHGLSSLFNTAGTSV